MGGHSASAKILPLKNIQNGGEQKAQPQQIMMESINKRAPQINLQR